MKTKAAERPAEVTTFLAGILILATAFGFDLSEGVLAAGLVVVTCLPAVVTYIVNIYRNALAGKA